MDQSEKEKADLCPLLFKHRGGCVNYDHCEVIDMRVQNFSVPPQEVRHCENKQALQGGLSNCERLQIKYQMECAGIDYYELEKEA